MHRYQEFCKTKGIDFTEIRTVRPYDDTTLFCIAGMQQYKSLFSDPCYQGTASNSQSCLRLDDLNEIGDGTHSLHFEMLGLFSFRQFSVQDSIEFWLEFLEGIGCVPDYVTIHPDMLEQWSPLYRGRFTIVPDPECTWSDGSISGYCTEFYKDGIEIGNIVNPLGDCIDCGFGLGRLVTVSGGNMPSDRRSILTDGINILIESGYKPGNKGQGYVLRKLLRLLWLDGGSVDHPFFDEERHRQDKLKQVYTRLLPRNLDKSPEWWFDTHGIDASVMGV